MRRVLVHFAADPRLRPRAPCGYGRPSPTTGSPTRVRSTGDESRKGCELRSPQMSGSRSPWVRRLRWLLEFEIEMVVVATSGIELPAAIGTRIPTPQVLMDGELCAASAAKDCFLVPFTLRPHLDRMTGERCVAILAGVIDPAALHLDGNDVGGAGPMSATGLGIEIDAAHFWKIRGHSAMHAFQPMVSSSS